MGVRSGIVDLASWIRIAPIDTAWATAVHMIATVLMAQLMHQTFGAAGGAIHLAASVIQQEGDDRTSTTGHTIAIGRRNRRSANRAQATAIAWVAAEQKVAPQVKHEVVQLKVRIQRIRV